VLHRIRRLRQSNRWIFGTMLLSALLSLTASFVLSVDAIALAADPHGHWRATSTRCSAAAR
jgi:hypothetical protein